MGILNPTNNPRLFLYSLGSSLGEREIDSSIFKDAYATTRSYAIDKSTVALVSGEEKLLAVYRASEGFFRAYDYRDADSIKQMITEDKAVLLLKIKVEKDEQ